MNSEIQAACHVLLFLQLTAAHHLTQNIELAEVIPLSVEDSSGPIVRTRAGPVRGRRATDGNYSMFLGVPYARIDPGNPFGPAVPHFFEDVPFDAFDDSAKCPQIEEFNKTITGTLDCLHLNIYVPNNASVEKPLAVLVFIFGGIFGVRFASRYVYGPRFLMKHDVILVTFNYRVGPYGFMCLNTPEVPGNQGLKDQVKALRWIKQNIQDFGGDTSRITLYGNSAGSMAVDLHIHYLQEKLFNRVILQSGVALVDDIFINPDPKDLLKLAKELNYTTNNISDALLFVSGVQPHELISATNKCGVQFGPCVEKQFNNDNYITTHPFNIKKVKDIEVLIGFDNDEIYVGYTILDKETFESLDTVSIRLNTSFVFNDVKMYTEIKDLVTHFYYGDEARNAHNRRPSMEVFTDFHMYHPFMRTIEKYLASGVENMYFYIFSYSGERNLAKHLMNVTHTEGGAAHADDLGYIFDVSFMKQLMQAKDMLIVDRMTELWTNFVKYGNPTPRTTELIPLVWPRVTQEKMSYMDINTAMQVGSRPMHERMAFHDLLFKTIGKYHKWLE